jgi:hypothetical protein
MVTGRTRTIGMLVPDIANPFFSELVRGAEAASMAASYMMIACSSELTATLEDRCVEVSATSALTRCNICRGPPGSTGACTTRVCSRSPCSAGGP